MLDIKWVRENPGALDRALANRAAKPQAAELIALDARRRAAVQAAQDAQTRRNAASKEIGQAKARKDEARAAELMAEVAALKDAIKAGEDEERAADRALGDALAGVPNVPLDDVPVGDETANAEVRRWGEPRQMNWAKEHFELGEALGLMDFETAAKLSGSRFVVLKVGLARLERALGQFMLDMHTGEHGYEEVQPPLLVNDEALTGTAQLPKFLNDQFFASTTSLEIETEVVLRGELTKIEEITRAQTGLSIIERDLFRGLEEILSTVSDPNNREAYSEFLKALSEQITEARSEIYHLRRVEAVASAMISDKKWLIPTAEVPLTNLVRESILAADQLPLRFTALTPCFRSEAGSAGRDTRGMLRQHQFNKVELVSITTPEQSRAEHERMTGCAEEVLKKLGLAFRTVLLSTGDMGFASQKTFDLEVWLPGQKAYREISSCSVCGDFQARRMNARYRAAEGKQPQFVHTLNGSGVAVGRALIAVMETYQNEDGSITVPDVLRPYMGGLESVGR